MAAPEYKYIPGVCNIGRAELKKRQRLGWIWLVVSVVLWGLMIVLKVPAIWRLILFIPALICAVGFLQAAWHFCAKFGMGGVFNFGPEVGKTDTVEQAEFRKKDRRTAVLIIGLSVLVGVVVAAAGYFVDM